MTIIYANIATKSMDQILCNSNKLLYSHILVLIKITLFFIETKQAIEGQN